MQGRESRLEPLRSEHAPGLFAAADPELFRVTPQAPPEWSIAGFEADIRHVCSLPGIVPFAIVDRATGVVRGRTTYMDIRPADRGLEIGRTWITRSRHGTRVNPEIKLLMLRHAFDELGALRVQFTTGHLNLHSQAAIAKLGAVREGTMRRNRILPDGTVRDTVVFSIIAEEWPSVRARLVRRLGYEP